MVSIPGVTFIFASLDGRLDLSDNFDLPCSFSRFIQRYNVERAIPHRRAVFVTEPVSVYIPSHFWCIRIFRISSFMPRRYRLRFVYEKKNCSVSIDTLHLRIVLRRLSMLFLHEVHHLIKPNLPPLILRHNPCTIFSYSSFLFFIDDSNIMRSALPVVVYIR